MTEDRHPQQINERHRHVAGDTVRRAHGLRARGFAGIERAEAHPRRLDGAHRGDVDAARQVQAVADLVVQGVVDLFGEIVDAQVRGPVLDLRVAAPAHGAGDGIGPDQQCREQGHVRTVDRDAPLAEKIGLESGENRVPARAGVDLLGQLDAHEQADRLLEPRRVVAQRGSQPCEIGILATGRDEGVDGCLVGGEVDLGVLPGAQIFLRILAQRLEHGALVIPAREHARWVRRMLRTDRR